MVIYHIASYCTLRLLTNSFWNIEQSDIGFGIGILSSAEVISINAFGAVNISSKGIKRQLPRITGYGNDVFKHYHIAPNCIGATTLLGAEEILEVVDKC